jgi:two-component system sensor histidine kinase YesM
MNIFTKIVSVIFLLLIPIMILYAFSHRVSVDVVREQAAQSSLDKLHLLEYQIESQVSQLAIFPIVVSNDPAIRKFVNRPAKDAFQYVMEESQAIQRFSLQSVSSSWINELNLYVPDRKLAISSNLYGKYDESYLREHLFSDWRYETSEMGGKPTPLFVRQYVHPAGAEEPDRISAVYQVKFAVSNLIEHLDRFESEGVGNPLLFHPDYPPIVTPKFEYAYLDRLITSLKERAVGGSGDFVVSLGNEEYLVQYVGIDSLGWRLVDYFPLRNTTASINASKNLFYVSTSLLLIMGVFVAFLLYKDVKLPLALLTSNLRKFKDGFYHARILNHKNDQFRFVNESFNEMAEHIQHLIEDIYDEKIRVREARLKQLQSQINPHFLYNSLFFIANMNELGDHDSASRMAYKLADYYRYATRSEQQNVTIREETALVENYLAIITMRNRRIRCEIDIPDDMMDLPISRLMIQPLVENAIVHGLDRIADEGWVRITGRRAAHEDEQHRIVVEDNGGGMTIETLTRLQARLNASCDGDTGSGMWNVHQRLLHQYGEGSGLTLELSREGGLRVIMHWNNTEPFGS